MVTNNNGVITVSGLGADVTITGFEANDRIVINGLGGDDVIEAAGLSGMLLTADVATVTTSWSAAPTATLLGGAGPTVLVGGAERNVLNGGPGSNVVIQSAVLGQFMASSLPRARACQHADGRPGLEPAAAARAATRLTAKPRVPGGGSEPLSKPRSFRAGTRGPPDAAAPEMWRLIAGAQAPPGHGQDRRTGDAPVRETSG